MPCTPGFLCNLVGSASDPLHVAGVPMWSQTAMCGKFRAEIDQGLSLGFRQGRASAAAVLGFALILIADAHLD